MPNLEVGIVQGLFTSSSFRGIQVERPRQEIDSERVGVGDGGPGLDRKRPSILLGTGRANTAESILRWRSQMMQDSVQLIDVTERL